MLIGRLLRYDAAGGAGMLLAPDVTYAQNIEHCERVGDKALTFVVVALGALRTPNTCRSATCQRALPGLPRGNGLTTAIILRIA